MMERRITNLEQLRLPEEGAPTGAGPGTGDNANDQRPGSSRRPGRGIQQPELQPIRQRSQIRPSAPPAQSAALNLPELTQAGLPRIRMQWTSSMNEHVVRSYFKATKLETLHVGYRQKLREEFLSKYPELGRISEQRIADQYRAIKRCNLIPAAKIEELRAEARRALEQAEQQIQAPGNAQQEQYSTSDGAQQQESEAADIAGNSIAQQSLTSLLNSLMDTALAEYEGTNPTFRPKIPRVNSSRRMAEIIGVMNSAILPGHIGRVTNLADFHLLLYCSAAVVVRALGLNLIHREDMRRGHRRPCPKWETRLNRKVENLRLYIGRLTEYIRGIRSKKLEKSVKKVMRRYKIHSRYDEPNAAAEECLDTMKQKLSVISARLRKYKTSDQRKKSNLLFRQNERIFYRKLKGDTASTPTVHPSQEEVQRFWEEQLSVVREFNANGCWLQVETQNMQRVVQQQQDNITVDEMSAIIRTLQNWKAPGPDNLQNFWLKRFSCSWEKLNRLINEVIREPQRMPNFLSQGVTYLLPKDMSNTHDPAKYRPITCLPTIYKIITSCIAKKISENCENNNIIAAEQNGCRRGSKGCKEQLIIDSVVCNQATTKNRNVYTAYIDYKKAFDSVPHDWLLKVLEVYKVDSKYISYLKHTMANWTTELCLNTSNGIIRTTKIKIRRGIFQGDSLSPLWFILAINPLSSRLNSTGYGFSIKEGSRELYRLSHLLYMDDIKIYAAKPAQLENLLKVVETFSNDICMGFGIDKCRTLRVIRGKLQPGEFQLNDGQMVQAMIPEETYKYLGFKQAKNICHTIVKEELTREFTERVRLISRSFLNSKHLFKALNTYAIPVLGYSFGVIRWTPTDIEALERKVRTNLSGERKHHPRSAIERMTLPRYMGGRGLIDIGNLLEGQIKSLREYFLTKSNTSDLHRAICLADEKTPLRLNQSSHQNREVTNREKVVQWMSKPLHGKHINAISQPNVDMKASNYWLTAGNMFPETEGHMIAIQDQVIPTRSFLKRIVGDTTIPDDSCRYGCDAVESIQHVVSGCTHFSGNEYKQRHDSIAKILHQELAFSHGLICKKDAYYLYKPPSVLENHHVCLYWDRTILTDQSITFNRPDIVFFDKNANKVALIDVAVPDTKALQEKFAEKISKYAQLIEPIKRQWKVKEVKIIPIIVSSTAVIPHNLFEGLRELGLSLDLYKEFQKSVVIATSRIVRRFMDTASTT